VYEEKLTDLRHSKVTLLTNKSKNFLDLISELRQVKELSCQRYFMFLLVLPEKFKDNNFI
jgi:hypothetical protein